MSWFSIQNLTFFVVQVFHFYQAIWRHRLMWYNGTDHGLPEHPFLFLNKLQSKPMNFIVHWLIRFTSMRFQRNILWIHGRDEARLPSALDSKSSWEMASFSNKIVQSNANPTRGRNQSIRNVFAHCSAIGTDRNSFRMTLDWSHVLSSVSVFRKRITTFFKLVFCLRETPDNVVKK